MTLAWPDSSTQDFSSEPACRSEGLRDRYFYEERFDDLRLNLCDVGTASVLVSVATLETDPSASPSSGGSSTQLEVARE